MSASVADLEVTIDAAVAYAARGWRPFPVDHPSLEVCAGTGDRCRRNREKLGDCPSDKRGKHPAGGWGTMTASMPVEKMLRMWFTGELRNIGIACGPSGLLVLDEDTLGALERLAGSLGESIPPTYRVRTSRGWHYYFEDPGNEFGNSAGALADWHIDVRGGRGSGGYVLAAGSMHWSGHVYAAEDEHVMPASLPDWVKKQLRASPTERESSGAGKNTGTGEWNDLPRYGSPDALRAQYERHLNAVRALVVPDGQQPNGGQFRHALYLAALDGWRLVDCELTDKITMLRQIKEAVRLVWRADPDDDDKEIVYDDARAKASDSPWVVSDPSDPDALSDEEVAERAYQRELEFEKRKLRLRKDASEALAAENREPFQILDIDEFMDSPMPEYLVPRMFYRDGLAVVFGAPGAAKSFLVLDIALCLATGKEWRGRSLGPRGKVHYVMAEGRSTNTLRTRAWFHYYELDRAEARGRFRTIPVPVILTEPGVADYLKVVEQDKPDMIILDTKNLMFAGKESQGEDYGAMLRILHRIREAAGGAAVIMVDHSGLTDDTRVRGSNAQKGGLETEVRVTHENAGIRRVEITRDKSGPEGAKWAFKLVQVPEVDRPEDMQPPAVCIPVSEDEIVTLSPEFEHDDNWNDPAQRDLPPDIGAFNGRGANAIKPLARFMRYSARGSVGFSLVQARKAIYRIYTTEKGTPTWSDDTVQRAWQSLIDLQRLHPVKGAGKTGNHVWEDRAEDFE